MDLSFIKTSPRAVLYTAGAFVFAGGLGLLVSLGQVLSDVDVQAEEQGWALPEPQRYRPPEAFQSVANAQLWKLDKRSLRKLRKNERQAEKKNDWTLLGLVVDGDSRYAVVQRQEDVELSYLSVGETLPTGEVITGLTETSLSFESETGSSVLTLYKRN